VSTRAEPAITRSSGGKVNPRKGIVRLHVHKLDIGLTFRLQRLIHLLDITKIVLPLE